MNIDASKFTIIEGMSSFSHKLTDILRIQESARKHSAACSVRNLQSLLILILQWDLVLKSLL